jgi:predicted glycoside hydrolase/deacetylase ChbG (UPF0249 family)
VNRGILEAHSAGVVSSVSVLVNTPGWADARDRLATLGEGLGVGLHLNLTAGAPLSAAPSLTHRRTGRFHSLPALVARALTGRIDPADVAAECVAQLTRLREAGSRVTHLDSHRHVHVLPGVWRAVVECARRHGIPAVRVPLESLAPAQRAGAIPRLKTLALTASWAVAARGAPPPGPPVRFYGISLQEDRVGEGEREGGFERRLLAFLDRLEPGTTELMVHPGHPDETLARWDGYTAPRAAELAALTSPAVVARFRSGAFRLVPFAAP